MACMKNAPANPALTRAIIPPSSLHQSPNPARVPPLCGFAEGCGWQALGVGIPQDPPREMLVLCGQHRATTGHSLPAPAWYTHARTLPCETQDQLPTALAPAQGSSKGQVWGQQPEGQHWVQGMATLGAGHGHTGCWLQHVPTRGQGRPTLQPWACSQVPAGPPGSHPLTQPRNTAPARGVVGKATSTQSPLTPGAEASAGGARHRGPRAAPGTRGQGAARAGPRRSHVLPRWHRSFLYESGGDPGAGPGADRNQPWAAAQHYAPRHAPRSPREEPCRAPIRRAAQAQPAHACRAAAWARCRQHRGGLVCAEKTAALASGPAFH